ncbi:hypothetical protein EMCRGX_G013809 [Ephydatia muelleri]|eukprot:Em0004g1370a
MAPNASSCANPLDPNRTEVILALMSGTGVASVLLCAVAIVLVLVLRLYRSLVYRLAVYQVLAAFLYGIVCALQIILKDDNYQRANTSLCQAIAFLMLYFQWVKLMFTIWVTAHLFFYAVFYKNLKKWELVYVLSSVLVPIVIAIVPFTTGSYGLAGAWCWVQNWKSDCPLNISTSGVIEQFTLWYGPALVFYVIDSVAVVVMAIVLIRRACQHSQEIKWRQHKEALTQMLPLLAYPITYTILLLVPIATRVHNARSHDPSTLDYNLLGTTGTCMSLWGLAAGASLLIHICVMKNRSRRKNIELVQYGSLVSEGTTVYNRNSSDANTFFEPPEENEIGDLSTTKSL